MNSFSASEPYLYLQVNLKPFGETGDCECYWEQNAQEVSPRQQETGFPYRTPKLPGLIMNKASVIAPSISTNGRKIISGVSQRFLTDV